MFRPMDSREGGNPSTFSRLTDGQGEQSIQPFGFAAMRKVYTSHNSAIIGHVRQVLENHAIRSIVRNDFLLGGAGELPVNETWPEIWVVDDRDFDRARRPRRCDRGGARLRSAVALRIMRRADGKVSSPTAGAAALRVPSPTPDGLDLPPERRATGPSRDGGSRTPCPGLLSRGERGGRRHTPRHRPRHETSPGDGAESSHATAQGASARHRLPESTHCSLDAWNHQGSGRTVA